MPLDNTNQQAEGLAREQSAATGETVTDAVRRAVGERRDRWQTGTVALRIARLVEISDRSAAGRRIAFDGHDDDFG